MRKGNIALKMRIFEKTLTQKKLAKETGISESIISMVVNGRYIPDNRERKRIAKALNCKIEDIFG